MTKTATATITANDDGTVDITFPDGRTINHKPRKGATHVAIAMIRENAGWWDRNLFSQDAEYRCDGSCNDHGEPTRGCNHDARWTIIKESKRADLAAKAFDAAVWQSRITGGHVIEYPEETVTT